MRTCSFWENFLFFSVSCQGTGDGGKGELKTGHDIDRQRQVDEDEWKDVTWRSTFACRLSVYPGVQHFFVYLSLVALGY